MAIEMDHTPADHASEGLKFAYQADEAFDAWESAETEDVKTKYQEQFHQLVKAAKASIGLGKPGGVELKPALQTPELLQEKVELAKHAMLEKYKKYGVKLEQFEAIQVGKQLVVAYTGEEGIDLGARPYLDSDSPPHSELRSWNSIRRDKLDPRFKAIIDGIEFDIRDGMTLELQQKLVEQGKIEADKDGNPKIRIWLTGERAGDDKDYAPVAGQIIEIEGKTTAIRRLKNRKSMDRRFRFRPAIVITNDLTPYGIDDYSGWLNSQA